MSSAYISTLKRMLDAEAERPLAGLPSLQDRFLAWYAALPEVSRDRPFAMVEFEHALQTQGKYLSPVLLQLGWSRKRKWTGRGQYHRYWVKSDVAVSYEVGRQ